MSALDLDYGEMSLIMRKDVTAVKFFRNYILAGIGSYVSIFDKQSGRLLQRLLALYYENIYGFVISKRGETVLVFGKKQLGVLKLVKEEGVVLKSHRDIIYLTDWIQSVVWTDDNNIAILTCHNAIVRMNINTPVPQAMVIPDYSVLYSGLLLPVSDKLLVLGGTVSSEINIRWFMESEVIHCLTGHRGVIFSISCDPNKAIIASTSDDRSLRIWEMLNPAGYPPDSTDFWQNTTIVCKYEVYGHNARVMRNIIVNDLVISGGEDAYLCYWKDGVLVRKVKQHQSAPVWCMDSDGKHLVTGGGDGAVKLHPLTVATEYGDKQSLQIDGPNKIINITARNNIVLLNANSEMIYYEVSTKFKTVHQLIHESTNKMMALSSCRQIIAVADMLGNLNVFVENCKDAALIQNIFETKLDIGIIFSMHFAGNRHLVLSSEEGKITVLTADRYNIAEYAKFTLPPCKERWLTACTIHPQNEMIVVADRCSRIHCYLKGKPDPVLTFTGAHNRYGSTSLTIKDNTLISTGRDGYITYYIINPENLDLSRCLTYRELDFKWADRFLDKDENLVAGFIENSFIVHSLKSGTKLIVAPCGGGHRSYDVIRYFKKVNANIEECIRFVYLKSSFVYLVDFQLSLIASKTIISGSHSKEINCLKVFKMVDNPMSFYVSGGEDTTLRVSTMEVVDGQYNFEDRCVYKHLSSVKTLKLFPYGDKTMVISAGGRAQICVNLIWVELTDNNEPKVFTEVVTALMLQGTDADRRRKQHLNQQEVDSDPEVRIMDLDAIECDPQNFFVFCGTSDSCIATFSLAKMGNRIQFKSLNKLKFYDNSCVLKVVCMELSENIHVVAASFTTGRVIICYINDEDEFELLPSHPNKYHIAGVNGLSFKLVTDDLLLMATGGDDTRVVLTLLEVIPSDPANLLLTKAHWLTDRVHSSQVTEVVLVGDNLLLSASIDQRVSIMKWAVSATTVECTSLYQLCSDIADIQGMTILDIDESSETSDDIPRMKLCVYGKGFEVIQIP